MPLVILIGASGSGKTTIAREIQHRNADVEVFFFDQIGVPSEQNRLAQGAGPFYAAATGHPLKRAACVVMLLNQRMSNVFGFRSLRLWINRE
jgi:adenylate kinase family enzyme